MIGVEREREIASRPRDTIKIRDKSSVRAAEGDDDDDGGGKHQDG